MQKSLSIVCGKTLIGLVGTIIVLYTSFSTMGSWLASSQKQRVDDDHSEDGVCFTKALPATVS